MPLWSKKRDFLFGPAATQRRTMEQADTLLQELGEQLNSYPNVRTKISTTCSVIFHGHMANEEELNALKQACNAKFADTGIDLKYVIEIKPPDGT